MQEQLDLFSRLLKGSTNRHDLSRGILPNIPSVLVDRDHTFMKYTSATSDDPSGGNPNDFNKTRPEPPSNISVLNFIHIVHPYISPVFSVTIAIMSGPKYPLGPYKLVTVNNAPERAKRLIGRVVEAVKDKYTIIHSANIDSKSSPSLVVSVYPNLSIFSNHQPRTKSLTFQPKRARRRCIRSHRTKTRRPLHGIHVDA